MARFSGSVRLRPVRVGFLVPPDDLQLVSRVAQLSTCLWGGRYNPIIPFFETDVARWTSPHLGQHGVEVARGYVDFFEPDILVEAAPGMAEKLGWQGEHSSFGLPRVLRLNEFYEVDHYGRVQFAAGIDIAEAMQELYEAEYKYERRHKLPFADVEQSPGNAFFDVAGGRYPTDEGLSYIAEGFRHVFSPEKLPASADTAMKFLKQGYAGPIWVSRHGLEENFGHSVSDGTFCVFDPTNAGDVIDFWNFRLVERRGVPINVEWFAEHKEIVRDQIQATYRPIPGNPFGTTFHSTVQFGASISEARCNELTVAHLASLPNGSFYASRPPFLSQAIGRGHNRRATKILATGKSVSFDEELGSERYVKLPAPVPSFLNATRRYTKARWVNLIAVEDIYQRPDPAIVYPCNLWSPEYPQLGNHRELRIGREGWALQQEHNIGYSLLQPQEGRAAIIEWLKTRGIDATPSEEGQIASRIIATAETLLACGMFADQKTLELLNDMAESSTPVSRNKKRTVKSTPGRSKHYHHVRQHFEERAKRSFGYWNKLDHFLTRSVFQAGLRVQCPVCAYYNWLALNTLSYKLACSRCLNSFDFSQTPEALRALDWHYRVTGPFAAPDYARGGYAVALTLRILASERRSDITWSTGIRLNPPDCEIDFIAWHCSNSFGDDEREEPLLVLGEAKSFGVGSINDETIESLKKTAALFPGAVMIVSTLREIGEYRLAEIARLRQLALWGRRSSHQGQPINPLIVLTGTELFARYNISNAWKEIDGKDLHPAIDLHDLHTLADFTQQRYLGLQPHWHRREASHMLEPMRRLLSLVQSRANQ